MDFSENRVMSSKKPGATMGRARVCKVCGKEGSMASILMHIENNHIEKVTIDYQLILSCPIQSHPRWPPRVTSVEWSRNQGMG